MVYLILKAYCISSILAFTDWLFVKLWSRRCTRKHCSNCYIFFGIFECEVILSGFDSIWAKTTKTDQIIHILYMNIRKLQPLNNNFWSNNHEYDDETLQIVITPLLTIIVVLTAAAIASVLAILRKLIVPAQD